MILSDLPTPPPGKTAWPWISESAAERESGPTEKWPRISIVTPSYEQAAFLEETIRSVLLQGYPNLEYIVVDGGSTDSSVDIIRKYERWISFWCSEKDRGQSHALNKGFDRATGQLRGFLNSDDVLQPRALFALANIVRSRPKERLLLMGDCEMGQSLGDKRNSTWSPQLPNSVFDVVTSTGFAPQPATYWTQFQADVMPSFNEGLHFVLDQAYWAKLMQIGYHPVRLRQVIAFYRHHPMAKGNTIVTRMWSELAMLPLLYLEQTSSQRERRKLCKVSTQRLRHYWRLRIFETWRNKGRVAALKLLLEVVIGDPPMFFERSTIGLLRRLLTQKYSSPE